MLAEVRKVWFDLDAGGGKLELETDVVAFKLCSSPFAAFPDHSTAKKYIWDCIQAKKDQLDWNDFNSIFSKGIFKDAIIGKA